VAEGEGKKGMPGFAPWGQKKKDASVLVRKGGRDKSCLQEVRKTHGENSPFTANIMAEKRKRRENPSLPARGKALTPLPERHEPGRRDLPTKRKGRKKSLLVLSWKRPFLGRGGLKGTAGF